MIHRIVSTIIVVLFVAIHSPLEVTGQSLDSLIYLIDNELVKDYGEKYHILCEIISDPAYVENQMQYCNQAIELAQKLDSNLAKPYVYKGIEYRKSGMLAQALECFFNAASYYKTEGKNLGLATTYLYIAQTYNQQEDYDNERLYTQKAIEIYEQEKDTVNLAYALHNLGYANYSAGQYDTALVLFSKTGDMFQKLGYTKEYAYCLGNSGLVYSRLSDLDKAEDYILRAIDTLTRYNDERPLTEYTIEYANILQQKGRIKDAIAAAALGLSTAKNIGIKEYERDASQTLAKLYSISGKYDSAFHYQSLVSRLGDIINLDTLQKMADLRTEFEVAAIQAEVDKAQKENTIKLIIILGLGIILFMAIVLVMLSYRSLKRSRKFTAALEERRVLLEKQKEEIISSINYAQRIQDAVLPPEAYITELVNENFILYKPKEIVSGDFYWIKQINQYIILVCADCTGHGVPGALMSMLGISCLNEIVQRKEITQANQVLNELRKVIKHSLRQTGKKEESRDGINMALCAIDTNKNIMQYSGAFNPLYIITEDNGSAILKEIKGDSMPVGVHYSSDKPFTNHEIQLNIGDTIYFSTDGYIDQIGGSRNTRFGWKNFKKLLLKIHDLPLFEQKEILEKTLNEWMGEQTQRDDILVIGARV